METKFNFNSAICTDRLQSERLLALGLKKETADMHYALVKQAGYPEWDYFLMPSPITNDTFESIPAWSLHRLWELYWSNKVGSDCLFGCGKHVSPYAKMIAMIEYDIEDGTFNKEYLNENI